ncbi:MAG: hypothetical protein E7338_05770 [Clostridiales bacterium]|nr:hypothetical protein [Clostridiales bacterium]
MEKLSRGKIYFIVVAAIALLALILVITTSSITYSNAKKAISEIGVVGYNEKSKGKIDDAKLKFDQFQTTLGASITFKVVNKKVGEENLQKAEAQYSEAAIRDVNNKYLAGAEEDEIKKELAEIRQIVDTYFANKDYSLISNYSTLTALEAKYGSQDTGASYSQQQSAEEPEIC